MDNTPGEFRWAPARLGRLIGTGKKYPVSVSGTQTQQTQQGSTTTNMIFASSWSDELYGDWMQGSGGRARQ